MLDLTNPKDAKTDERLRNDVIIWLGTVRPDGRPHNVPVWYWWDGEAILIFSEPETQKIRNLRHAQHVYLALDTADQGEEVVMLEGVAELTTQPSSELMPDGFGDKYAALFARTGSTPEQMKAQYTQPIRVTPTKFRAW